VLLTALLRGQKAVIKHLTLRGGVGESDDVGGCLSHLAGHLLVDSVIAEDCVSDEGGGGIAIRHSATMRLTDSIIRGNHARGAFGPGMWGGGIENEGTLLIQRSLVTRNLSDNHAGGIWNTGTLRL
jgi:hypothetical protein